MQYLTDSFKYRVYYEHTDSGGVVYHSRYLNFFERARSDWLRQRGIIQSQLQQNHNMVYAVTAANIKYKKPARMDDTLRISCQVIKIKRASMELYQEMYNQHDVLLAIINIKMACLKADTFSVIAIPEHIKERL